MNKRQKWIVAGAAALLFGNLAVPPIRTVYDGATGHAGDFDAAMDRTSRLIHDQLARTPLHNLLDEHHEATEDSPAHEDRVNLQALLLNALVIALVGGGAFGVSRTKG